jgi:meso-butanediol dehydrogenase / (S,S)-butanediol dehydrogenase / diacetyl reductase
LHFARGLAGAGASVAMLARSADALRAEAAAIGEAALPLPTDISDPDAVRAAFATTAERFGGVDILVNSATLNYAHRIEEATDAQLRAQIGVNVLGQIYCIREAIICMKRRGAGDIVNISSESVLRPFPFLATYAASKAALEMLSVGLRNELRGDHIRITTLRSGSVASGGAFLSQEDPSRLAAFMEAAMAGGFLQDVGEAISPAQAVSALLDVVSAPRGVHIDLVSVRAV